MAWLALMTRLSSAFSSWPASMRADHRSALACTCSATRGPSVRPNSSCIEAMRRAMSTRRISSDWRRAKASSRCVNAAARWVPVAARSSSLSKSAVWPAFRRRCMSWIEPYTVASMLLKSCAMPPVSWPIDSIFCDWRNCSCTCSNARACALACVMSRPKQKIAPPSGAAVQAMSRKLPSACRVRHSKFGSTPEAARSSADSVAGTSSGWTISSMRRPTRSAERQPRIAVHAGFTSCSTPAASSTTIRSGELRQIRSRSRVRSSTRCSSVAFNARSASRSARWSSISVLVPTQRTTSPDPSLRGMARTRCHR